MSSHNPFEPGRSLQTTSSTSQDSSSLSTGDILLCVLCSGIGCIVGIVRLIQGKPNAGKMIGLSFAFVIVWNIVRAFIQIALQQR